MDDNNATTDSAMKRPIRLSVSIPVVMQYSNHSGLPEIMSGINHAVTSSTLLLSAVLPVSEKIKYTGMPRYIVNER